MAAYLSPPPASLRGFTDLLIFTRGSLTAPTILGYSPRTGIVSARLNLKEPVPFETIASMADQMVSAGGTTLADLPWQTASAVISDPRMLHEDLIHAVTGVARWAAGERLADEIEDRVSLLVRGAIPEEALETLRRLENLHEYKLHDALTYLSSGDIEARVQALRSFPMISDVLIRDPGLQAVIDARGRLGPAVADMLDLDPGQFRIYSQIERQVSTLGFAPGAKGGLAHVVSAFLRSRDLMIDREPRKEGDDIEIMRKNAVAVARRCRIDQVPEHEPASASWIAGSARSPMLRMLTAMDGFRAMDRRTGLGPGPFDRIIRRSGRNTWDEVQSDAIRQLRSIMGLTDYLDQVALAIGSVLIVGQLRQTPGIPMGRIEDAATALMSDKAPDEADGECLQVLIGGFKRHLQHLWDVARPVILREIGDAVSMKDLASLNTRWHHRTERLQAVLLSSGLPYSWEPLIGSLESGGVNLRELASSEELTLQGRKENHCVGGYGRTILGAGPGGLTLIFGVEDRQGNTLSTLEMIGARQSSGWTWRIGQNLAARNAEAPLAAVQAATALQAHLETLPQDAVDGYLRRLGGNAVGLREMMAVVFERAGANITNASLPERILEEFGPVLPPALRDRDLASWSASIAAGSEAGATLMARIEAAATQLAQEMPAELELAPGF